MSLITVNVVEEVQAAQWGESDAFGKLYEEFRPVVLAQVYACFYCRTDAEDIVQDIFLHAWQKIRQLKTPTSFRSWLRRIAHNMIISLAARRGVRMCDLDPDQLEGPGSLPLEQMIVHENAAMLHKLLGELDSIDRATLV